MAFSDDIPTFKSPLAAMSWQLVWCYERCHKAENQAQRQVIKRVARTVGASLVCLKKARQFGAWMDRSERSPFVLVTDWREAQPCLRAVTQHSGPNVPAHMVVLCEGRRQYMRALDWARVLRPDVGLVHICERSAIPEWLLNGVIKACFTPVAPLGEVPEGHLDDAADANDNDSISGSNSDGGAPPPRGSTNAAVLPKREAQASLGTLMKEPSLRGQLAGVKAPVVDDALMQLYSNYMQEVDASGARTGLQCGPGQASQAVVTESKYIVLAHLAL